VCCGVLRCVVAYCSVLPCVAVGKVPTRSNIALLKVLELRHNGECARQCVAVWCGVLQCVTVCCSVLQYVAVCFSVLHCVAVGKVLTPSNIALLKVMELQYKNDGA